MIEPPLLVPQRIFVDKRVFELNHIPERILHREPQIQKIQSILADFRNGVRPRDILGVGDFGTGKTAVVRSICHALSTECMVTYVNCAEENTQNRIIRAVLANLGVVVKPGYGSDHYLRLFKDHISRHSRAILILDEVDKFVERKESQSDELFYTLSRSLNNVVAILLTNRISFESTLLSTLDSRVKDTFRLERVEFGDYCASELGDILRDRCQNGLRSGAYDEGIVAMIARMAFERGLRARGVVDLARKAAEIAELRGHEAIAEEDVRQASYESSHDREMDIVRRLPPIHRAILGYILSRSPSSTEAFEWYRNFAKGRGFGQSFVVFHTYLRELETLGLVVKQKHGLGRGRGVLMKMAVPPEMISIVSKSLLDQDSTPTPPPNM